MDKIERAKQKSFMRRRFVGEGGHHDDFDVRLEFAGGTGLGLSIVYQIIREHGGTINVRSREGQGTTITIELPSSKMSEVRV